MSSLQRGRNGAAPRSASMATIASVSAVCASSNRAARLRTCGCSARAAAGFAATASLRRAGIHRSRLTRVGRRPRGHTKAMTMQAASPVRASRPMPMAMGSMVAVSPASPAAAS